MSKCKLNHWSFAEVLEIGEALRVNWDIVDPEEFCMGMHEELEHKDITRGDPIMTGKIVLAHLKERPDYYSVLEEAMRTTPRRKHGRGSRR